MIQTKIQFNLKNAQQYFREHLGAGDYYSEGQSVTGEWLGLGAEKLGLKGEVMEEEFLALCEGKHPETGERLGQRLNSVRQEDDGVKANRRIFFDFTISPPKSVSVVALIRDARIVKLHEQAVRKTMSELEKRAEARIRRVGQNGQRITGNLVAALFRHETSRELDPQLHTHCVVMNATFDQVENRWKALHPVAMYQAHRFATAYYRHELAKGLRGLGYEIENHPKGFEIRGVSRSVIDRFSKRHQQIEQETRERLAKGEVVENVKDLRERIAHGNRRRKVKNSTAERLRETWRNEMTPDERSSLNSLRSASIREGLEVNLADTLIWSEALVFDRRAVVFEHELMAAALERSRGQDFDLPELHDAIAERDYVREKGTERLTSREVLACELQVVVAARDGRSSHEALNRDHAISPSLSEEQTAAVTKILQSRDFITLFRGAAGTGKSFTLKEVHHGLLALQRPVTILAPQRQQVQDLKADGLPATTLSEVLMTRKITPRSVVILDEAGQVGARQLAQLVGLIKAQNGRLILSGDTRQHGAVAASDALRGIEKYSGLKPAILKSIRRQDPRLAQNAEERLQIRAYRAAVKLASEGKSAESFAALDQLGWIKEVSEEDRRGLLAREYLSLIEKKQRALVVAQTRAEVAEINETIRAQLLAAGKLGPSVAIETFSPVDLGEAQKQDSRFYQQNHAVFFHRSYGRFKKGEVLSVRGADERGLLLEKNGMISRMSYRYADRFAVVERRAMDVATGDRLQLKLNTRSREGPRMSNGELVTVRQISTDDGIKVEGADGKLKSLVPHQFVFQRGYAVTSYGSQGKTVDAVLFADAANQAATSAQQWYVTISRGRKRLLVITPNKEALRAGIAQLGNRDLAMDLSSGPAGVRQAQKETYRYSHNVAARTRVTEVIRQRPTQRHRVGL